MQQLISTIFISSHLIFIRLVYYSNLRTRLIKLRVNNMNEKGNKYAKIAIQAAYEASQGGSPAVAWKNSAEKEYANSPSSVKNMPNVCFSRSG